MRAAEAMPGHECVTGADNSIIDTAGIMANCGCGILSTPENGRPRSPQ